MEEELIRAFVRFTAVGLGEVQDQINALSVATNNAVSGMVTAWNRVQRSYAQIAAMGGKTVSMLREQSRAEEQLATSILSTTAATAQQVAMMKQMLGVSKGTTAATTQQINKMKELLGVTRGTVGVSKEQLSILKQIQAPHWMTNKMGQGQITDPMISKLNDWIKMNEYAAKKTAEFKKSYSAELPKAGLKLPGANDVLGGIGLGLNRMRQGLSPLLHYVLPNLSRVANLASSFLRTTVSGVQNIAEGVIIPGVRTASNIATGIVRLPAMAANGVQRVIGFVVAQIQSLRYALRGITHLTNILAFGGAFGLGGLVAFGARGSAEMKNLGGAFQQLARSVADTFAPQIRMLTGIILNLQETWKNLTPEVKASISTWALVGTTLAGVTLVMTRLVSFAAGVLETVVLVFRTLAAPIYMVSGLLSSMLGVIGQVAEGFVRMAISIGSVVMSTMASLAAIVVQFTTTLISLGLALISTIATLGLFTIPFAMFASVIGGLVGRGVLDAFENFFNFLAGGAAAAGNGIQKVWEVLTNFFSEIPEKAMQAKEKVQEFFQLMTKDWGAGLKQLVVGGAGLWNSMLGGIESAVTSLKMSFSNLWDEIRIGVAGVIDVMMEMGNTISRIVSFLPGGAKYNPGDWEPGQAAAHNLGGARGQLLAKLRPRQFLREQIENNPTHQDDMAIIAEWNERIKKNPNEIMHWMVKRAFDRTKMDEKNIANAPEFGANNGWVWKANFGGKLDTGAVGASMDKFIENIRGGAPAAADALQKIVQFFRQGAADNKGGLSPSGKTRIESLEGAYDRLLGAAGNQETMDRQKLQKLDFIGNALTAIQRAFENFKVAQ